MRPCPAKGGPAGRRMAIFYPDFCSLSRPVSCADNNVVGNLILHFHSESIPTSTAIKDHVCKVIVDVSM